MINTSQDLKDLLFRINRKSYPAYKDTKGSYRFPGYVLSIDHVQGDPFAAPSKISLHIKGAQAGFPESLYATREMRIALQNQLIRGFAAHIEKYNFRAKGSGKSGLIAISKPGQEILERSACTMDAKNGDLIIRLEVGFPANGRTINSGELIKILFDFLPVCVKDALFYRNLDARKLEQVRALAEDQTFIRKELAARNLTAFVANGSVLPRESGVSSRPMKNGIPFVSPDSMAVTLDLPNHGPLTGMGIPCGITLIVGGGYHGKSTLLKALELGVYNHIAGDGREYVITDDTAVKIRAEDGRSIKKVDISMFINDLPNGKDTSAFRTEDASGSTSQAANVVEAMEAGAETFLIDEDTSATNFMIRDELMQRVVNREDEPITPFIERCRSMYDDLGVSSIIVAGSSGSFFGIADTIIQMKEYVPYDITERAREAAASYPALKQQEHFPVSDNMRAPKANQALKKDPRLKMKTMGTNEMLLAKDAIELRYLEQLIDPEQTNALAYALKYLELNRMNGSRTVPQLLDDIEALTASKGLSALYDKEYVRSGLAMPRRQEIAACLNRYRKLYFN